MGSETSDALQEAWVQDSLSNEEIEAILMKHPAMPEFIDICSSTLHPTLWGQIES